MITKEKYNAHYKYNSDNNNNFNPYSTELNQTQITLSNKPEDIIATKRKIEILTIHLKPHISKILNEVLQNNPINARVICD